MYFEGAKRSLDIVGFSSFFFSHRLGQPTNNTTHTGHPLIIKWVGALIRIKMKLDTIFKNQK